MLRDESPKFENSLIVSKEVLKTFDWFSNVFKKFVCKKNLKIFETIFFIPNQGWIYH